MHEVKLTRSRRRTSRQNLSDRLCGTKHRSTALENGLFLFTDSGKLPPTCWLGQYYELLWFAVAEHLFGLKDPQVMKKLLFSKAAYTGWDPTCRKVAEGAEGASELDCVINFRQEMHSSMGKKDWFPGL